MVHSKISWFAGAVSRPHCLQKQEHRGVMPKVSFVWGGRQLPDLVYTGSTSNFCLSLWARNRPTLKEKALCNISSCEEVMGKYWVGKTSMFANNLLVDLSEWRWTQTRLYRKVVSSGKVDSYPIPCIWGPRAICAEAYGLRIAHAK